MAYFGALIRQLFRLKLRHFTLTIDGVTTYERAAEVLVLNQTVLGIPMLDGYMVTSGNDGKVEVFIIYARTMLESVIALWEMLIGKKKKGTFYRQVEARSEILICTSYPLKVQSGGDVITTTPVTIKILPHHIRVLCPPPLQDLFIVTFDKLFPRWWKKG
jgi:diacylglycerol kinase family enzyme